jgi:hypothetical protein
MLPNRQVNLNILPPGSCVLVIKILLILAAVSSMLSSYPGLALLLVMMVFGFDFMTSTLGLFKTTKNKLTLVIFADGQVRLKSDSKIKIEGFLGSQHWCTRHAVVLTVLIGGKAQKLVVLSALQKNKNDYRRLMMWLRQDIYRDTEGVQVSGN